MLILHIRIKYLKMCIYSKNCFKSMQQSNKPGACTRYGVYRSCVAFFMVGFQLFSSLALRSPTGGENLIVIRGRFSTSGEDVRYGLWSTYFNLRKECNPCFQIYVNFVHPIILAALDIAHLNFANPTIFFVFSPLLTTFALK